MAVSDAFWSALASQLGVPQSAYGSFTTFMNQWQPWEGGWTNNSATYNPLNTTMPGGTSINSVGVQAYPTMAAGVAATAATIANYPVLLNALQTGNFSNTQGLAQELNTWGTGTFANMLVNGQVNLPQAAAAPPPQATAASVPAPAGIPAQYSAAWGNGYNPATGYPWGVVSDSTSPTGLSYSGVPVWSDGSPDLSLSVGAGMGIGVTGAGFGQNSSAQVADPGVAAGGNPGGNANMIDPSTAPIPGVPAGSEGAYNAFVASGISPSAALLIVNGVTPPSSLYGGSGTSTAQTGDSAASLAQNAAQFASLSAYQQAQLAVQIAQYGVTNQQAANQLAATIAADAANNATTSQNNLANQGIATQNNLANQGLTSRGQDITASDSAAQVAEAKYQADQNYQIGMANATTAAQKNQIDAAWNAEQARIAQMTNATQLQANQTSQFGAETSRATGMGQLALANNAQIETMATTPRDLPTLFMMQRGIAPDWATINAGGTPAQGQMLAPTNPMTAYVPTTPAPTYGGSNPYVDAVGAHATDGQTAATAAAGNPYLSAAAPSAPASAPAPAPYTAPSVPGYTPPAPAPAVPYAGGGSTVMHAAQGYPPLNPNNSGTGTETSPHIVANNSSSAVPGGTATGDVPYSGVPNSQVAGMTPGQWSLVTTGTAGPSLVSDYNGFGVFDSSKNAMGNPNQSIAPGTPLWLQKMAAGGPTHAQLLMAGDAAGPNPSAGGAMPEIIQNPTGAPLNIMPNPQQAPPDPTGIMSQAPQQNPMAPPPPQGQAPSPGYAGTQNAELPQDAALRMLVKHLIEYGTTPIQRFALGTGNSSSQNMNSNVYQYGGPTAATAATPYGNDNPTNGGGYNFGSLNLSGLAGYGMQPHTATQPINTTNLTSPKVTGMQATAYPPATSTMPATGTVMNSNVNLSPPAASTTPLVNAAAATPAPTGQDIYNAAGMGSAYIPTSANTYANSQGTPMPTDLAALAGYGFPISPSLYASTTGTLAPPQNAAGAFTGLGGGVLPSLQQYTRQTPSEQGLLQGYAEGNVGVPWADMISGLTNATAGLRSAATTRSQ